MNDVHLGIAKYVVTLLQDFSVATEKETEENFRCQSDFTAVLFAERLRLAVYLLKHPSRNTAIDVWVEG